MKKNLHLYAERLYPYVCAIILWFLIYINKINFLFNDNIDKLIDGIITMESIVIGLIGAIIPVILSMKNDSKFVKYVFENDKKNLFRKYMTITIGVGIISIALSLSMYVRDEFSCKCIFIIYNSWLLSIVLFLLLTYRSLKYMIIIIFMPDMDDNESTPKLSNEEKEELRRKYSNNQD